LLRLQKGVRRNWQPYNPEGMNLSSRCYEAPPRLLALDVPQFEGDARVTYVARPAAFMTFSGSSRPTNI
jgi:hypothetical protein